MCTGAKNCSQHLGLASPGCVVLWWCWMIIPGKNQLFLCPSLSWASPELCLKCWCVPRLWDFDPGRNLLQKMMVGASGSNVLPEIGYSRKGAGSGLALLPPASSALVVQWEGNLRARSEQKCWEAQELEAHSCNSFPKMLLLRPGLKSLLYLILATRWDLSLFTVFMPSLWFREGCRTYSWSF